MNMPTTEELVERANKIYDRRKSAKYGRDPIGAHMVQSDQVLAFLEVLSELLEEVDRQFEKTNDRIDDLWRREDERGYL